MRNRGALCRIVLFLCCGNSRRMVDALKGATPSSPEILAAIRPFQREIDTLKEQLDSLEARHDTLEAATEQFRLKNKSLREKLAEEKARYDDLAVMKTNLEHLHEQEIESWKSLSDEAMKKAALLEAENESIRSNQSEREAAFEKEMALKTSEILKYEEELQAVSAEFTHIKATLEGTERELMISTEENLKLRRDNSILQQNVLALEDRAKMSPWQLYWQGIAESDLASTLIDLIHEYWDWFEDDILPALVDDTARLCSAIREKSLGLLRNVRLWFYDSTDQIQLNHAAASELIHGSINQLDKLNPNQLSKSLRQAITGICERAQSNFTLLRKNFVRCASSYLHTSSRHKIMIALNKLELFHELVSVVIEWFAVAASSYYIVNMDGSRSDLSYRVLTALKSRRSETILFFEIIFGLLILDFALTSAVRGYSRWSMLRRRPQTLRTTTGPKGSTSNTSLLRTAGGLTMRPQ